MEHGERRNVGGRGLDHDEARVVRCAECGCSSGLRWAGWRACRIDEFELGEPPTIAYFCPGCAEREFGA